MRKIKLEKSKLELHLQEFRNLVEELMHTDDDNNETDLKKDNEELDSIGDVAMLNRIPERTTRKGGKTEKNNLNGKNNCKVDNLKRRIN